MIGAIGFYRTTFDSLQQLLPVLFVRPPFVRLPFGSFEQGIGNSVRLARLALSRSGLDAIARIGICGEYIAWIL
jgi:hypothetical protein